MKRAAPPAPAAPPLPRFGEPQLLAVIAVAICALQTWLTRYALSPDGVSYLDLAGRATAGDWSSFVQGYWSPLYPALIALVSLVTGRDPVSLTVLAHSINGVAAALAIGLLWHWSREK